jgi:ACS family hexuronate transporter-like MFS transporter
MMADRWNVRWIYPMAVLLWSSAGFLTGFVGSWYGLMACRFFLGLTEAGHWPCALRTTQHVLPPARRTLGNSILQSGAAIGAIFTPLIVLALMGQTGNWRHPFWIIGTLGIIWVILWLLTVRKNDLAMHTHAAVSVAVPPRRQSDSTESAIQPDGNPIQKTLQDAAVSDTVPPAQETPWGFLRDRRFIILVVVVLSINTAWHFFRAWLTTFLKDQGYDREEAILFNSAYYTAADAGSLFAGFGTLYLTRRGMLVHRSRMVLFTLCTFLTMLGGIVAFLPAGPWMLVLLMVAAFGSLGLFPNYYAFSQELTVRHQGKLTGSLGFIAWMSVAAMQALVGFLVERTGSHKIGVLFASLGPLIGCVAMVFFWRDKPAKT